ncbi:unnamed protein product [Knipowitschia caucasica]|uniref:Transmembrane protein 100 n=1 Tax=Knipowitschia caucasica TaxID=637954 RepID=A0AAV2LC19_KNICA
MAHLFLASKLSLPDNGKARMPRSASARFPNDWPTNHSKQRPVAMMTRSSSRSADIRLSAATGGSEASCWRCLLPFGSVMFVGGTMLTALGFWAMDPGALGPPRMGLLGLTILVIATLLLATSATCWRLSLRKSKRDKRRESQAVLVQSVS